MTKGDPVLKISHQHGLLEQRIEWIGYGLVRIVLISESKRPSLTSSASNTSPDQDQHRGSSKDYGAELER